MGKHRSTLFLYFQILTFNENSKFINEISLLLLQPHLGSILENDSYIFFISNTCHMLVMFLYFYLQLNRTGSWKMTSILNWRVFTLPRVKGGGLHFLHFTPQQTDSCCKFSIYSRADRCCYLHWLCQNIVQTWLTTHFLWFFFLCVYV